MPLSFDTLEQRLDQLISVHGDLRTENENLSRRVARLEAEKAALCERIEIAALRLEGLLEHLPNE